MTPHFRPALLAAALAPLFATPAFAQSHELDTVVVTATRQAQRISETIANVTVLEQEQIERSSASTLGELLGRVAGIEFSRTGSRGAAESVYIRGTESSHTLMLIDGVRFGSATLGISPLELVPLNQISRIEIVRGPASSIYGSDAIGGVINIITRREQPGSTVSLGYGNRGSYEASLSTAQTLDRLQLSARVGFSGTDGFNSLTSTGNPFYNSDKDGSNNRNGSLDLRYKLSNDSEIGASHLESISRTRLDNALYDPNFFTYSSANLDYKNQDKITRSSVFARTQLTDFWSSQLQFGQSQNISEQNLPTTVGQPPQKFTTTQEQVAWQNDLKLPLGNALVLLEHLGQQVGGTQSYAITNRHINSASLGWTAQVGAHAWQLNARNDNNSQFGDRATYSAGYGFRLTPLWRLSGSYGTAFKAPTFNDLYYPNDGFGQGNAALKPESSKNTELAVQYDDGRNLLKLSWFKNQITDLIQWAPTANPFFWTPSNVGKAEIDGWELQGSTRIGDWQLAANANLQNPRYLVDGPDGSTKPGDTLRRRAKEFARFELSRQFGPLFVAADMVTTGPRNEYYWDWGNNRQGILKMGGYTLFNLRADWQLAPRTKAFVQANNLFNREYETAKSSTTTYATPGFSFLAGIRHHF